MNHLAFLRRVVRELEAKLSKLKRNFKAGELSEEDYNEQAAEVYETIREINEDIKEQKERAAAV